MSITVLGNNTTFQEAVEAYCKGYHVLYNVLGRPGYLELDTLDFPYYLKHKDKYIFQIYKVMRIKEKDVTGGYNGISKS